MNKPLETFLKKYQTAKNYNSKEIRLTIAEAEELSIAIALQLSESVELSKKVIILQDQLLNTELGTNISGGSFT